jgi:hypothetical protein
MGPLIDPLFKEAIHRLTMPATVLSNSYRYQITQIFDSVSGLPVIGKRVIAGADGNASWAELLNEAQILHHLRGVSWSSFFGQKDKEKSGLVGLRESCSAKLFKLVGRNITQS